MTSVCSERFLLRDIDIPPRKQQHDEESLLMSHKFLPSGDSDSDDPYSSDHFRMYEFKVRRCTRSRSHDWTDCPFAHPGEKARRRDPRRHHYSGAVCPEYRRGGCGRGDACEFAHGVFECWLHPARYRTEACKDGKHCKRKVCFFAHSPRQLRLLPATNSEDPPKKGGHQQRQGHSTSSNSNKCCVFCSCPHHHHHHHHQSPSTASPTSTLLGMSHLSPPLSPMSYKDALTDYLMTSLEALHFTNPSDHLLSPTTSDSTFFAPAPNRYPSSNTNPLFSDDSPRLPPPPDHHFVNAGSSNSDPDLAWVNDLLM